MDKNSNTWREIMDLSKNNPKQMDDSSMLRSLGLDEETMNKIEEDTLESAKEQIKVRVSFMNTSSNEDPKHKYIDDSGMDLRANLEEPISIKPSEIKLIPTGLHFELPESMEIQVRPRSGLAAKNGITVLNTPGTVDRGYSGEIKVILINLGKDSFLVSHGDRIAQAVISPVISGRWCILTKKDKLANTKRSDGGFGSTGIN
jgi:dUTP pyrophosphatase|tara:strand:+ start:130 stop:735 length:606 start_codon:yes stop_codon:yes gene_type:complete